MWCAEAGLCTLALASLAAQAILLQQYDGKPQEAWHFPLFKLDGVIQILMAWFRNFYMTAVFFICFQLRWMPNKHQYHRLGDPELPEEASKGFWGTVKRIWRSTTFYLISIFLFWTFTATVSDNAAKYLVTLQVDQVESPSQTKIGAIARGRWANSVEVFNDTWTPRSATKLAMHNGFISPSIEFPQVNCPTGSCTWPIVPTVGVCGSCVNLTDEIHVSRGPPPMCTVTSPDGSQLSGKCNANKGENAEPMTVFTIGNGSGRVFDSSIPRMVKSDASNLIAEFSALGVPSSKLPQATLKESLATECTIWYCLQAHNVSVELGELKDSVVDTWSEISGSSYPDGSNVTFTNIPFDFNTEANGLYEMGPMQVYAMRSYAKEVIVGNVSVGDALGVVSMSISDYAEGMHAGFDNVDTWMERLTRSMTNDIRLNNNEHTEGSRFRGTMFVSQVTFLVHWDWMLCPVALILPLIVYLMVVPVRRFF
ncbi:hypothetical protein EsH8_III_000137 [Colletotrichum jinshuiense]